MGNRIVFDLKQVEELAGRGLTYEQIALALGIHVSTLHARKAADSEIFEAIQRGRAKGIESVSNALFENAMSGNVTAQIFFLKNRAPNEWMDRVEQRITGSMTYQNLSDEQLEADVAALAEEIGISQKSH